MKTTWKDAPKEGRAGAVARAVHWLVVTRLIDLAGNESADSGVRAVASHALALHVLRIEGGLGPGLRLDPDSWAIAREIHRFLNRPDATHRRAEPPPSPPGDPIGGGN